MKITFTKTIEVPDKDVCENWAYRTNMDKKENWRCEHLRDTTTYISGIDAQNSGLGYSGGLLLSFHCAIFDKPLSHEIGVGPFKCKDCKRTKTQ